MRLGAVRFKARILNGRQDVALGGYTEILKSVLKQIGISIGGVINLI